MRPGSKLVKVVRKTGVRPVEIAVQTNGTTRGTILKVAMAYLPKAKAAKL